jgi:trans-aconitate methyltransferase
VTPAPVGWVDPRWLSLRGPADAHARTTFTAGLAADLALHLTRRLPGDGDVARLVDLGAGTGLGASWLRARLPVEQDWRLVDHDRSLLAAAPATVEGWARGIVADVTDLPGLLAEEPAHVVTCQALLDILTADEVDAMLAPAMASGAALLLSLNVTGEVALAPRHRDDGLVAGAFNAHQRRAGRLGPDAGTYAADVLRDHGYEVSVTATPWQLDAAESDLILSWLQGYAAAALEQQPDQADRIGRWQESRETAAADGGLSVVVGHLDVLGLPAGSVT